MAIIDVDRFLVEIAADAPCGPDLSYDPGFLDLERAVSGTPERRMGEAVIEAVPPNWSEVRDKAIALSERTRDLRVAVTLARASLHTAGWSGFDGGLALVHGLLERRWDSVWPQLDREDNDDPTMRVNAVVGLCGADAVLRELRLIPIVNGGPMGRFTYRDWLLATGKAPLPEGAKAPSTSEIDAAFSAADLDGLQAYESAISSAIERTGRIEATLAEKVGAERAASFDALIEALHEIRQPLAEALRRRGVAVATDGAPAEGGNGAGVRVPGQLATREDAVRMIETVRDWFLRNEPSSPVPILLDRARKLVSKDFLEIVRDLAPDGLSQAERFRGSQDAG